MSDVIIWKKSVYDTQKCGCGYKVVSDENMLPAGDVLFDMKNGLLYCPKCGNLIAKVREDDRSQEELKQVKETRNGQYDRKI